MTKSVRGRKIETVFVLIIFSVFVVSSLLLMMLGGNVYINTTEKSQRGYEERTCFSYIWAKVKYNDVYERVHVDAINGLSALCLEEEYDGVQYDTWIYFYDGWMRELYCEKGLVLSLDSGEPIIKVGSLSFVELEQGLIEVTADSGRLLISPRGKGGVPVG